MCAFPHPAEHPRLQLAEFCSRRLQRSDFEEIGGTVDEPYVSPVWWNGLSASPLKTETLQYSLFEPLEVLGRHPYSGHPVVRRFRASCAVGVLGLSAWHGVTRHVRHRSSTSRSPLEERHRRPPAVCD